MVVKKGLYESVINHALSSNLAEAQAELEIKGTNGWVQASQVLPRTWRAFWRSLCVMPIQYGDRRRANGTGQWHHQLAQSSAIRTRFSSRKRRTIIQQPGKPGYLAPLTSVALVPFSRADRNHGLHRTHQEISSADRIDLLISFIGFWRACFCPLSENTLRQENLCVITTATWKPTTRQWSLTTSPHPGAISYRRNALAQSLLLSAETGFSAAYIGSAICPRRP